MRELISTPIIILPVLMVFVLTSYESNAQWHSVYADSDSLPFIDISFISEDTGYVVNDNEIFQTIDNGNTWNSKFEAEPGEAGLVAISFGSEEVGFVMGDFGLHTGLVTNDRGDSWEYVNGLMSATSVTDVWCLNEERCIATKYFSGGYLLSTFDGFNTYEMQLYGEGCANWMSVYFVNADTGYICGWDCEKFIYKTVDGGEIWNPVVTVSPLIEAINIFFPNSSTGYGIFGFGTTFGKSIDFGNTWTEVEIPFENVLIYTSYFLNENIGYIGGEYLDTVFPFDDNKAFIAKTINGGITWMEEFVDEWAETIRSIYCLESGDCFAGTYNGKIITNKAKDTTTQINENINVKSLNVFPNPTAKSFTITFPMWNLYEIIIINISGEIIETYKQTTQSTQIDISGLPNGLYLVKVENDLFSETIKIQVIH